MLDGKSVGLADGVIELALDINGLAYGSKGGVTVVFLWCICWRG